MKKTMLSAVALAISGFAAMTAQAHDHQTVAYKCAVPVLQVSADLATTQYTVNCESGIDGQPMPTLSFAGELKGPHKGPYPIKATYTVDSTSIQARMVGFEPRADQRMVGEIATSVDSVATLPAQLVLQTHWDAESNSLSIEETPNNWRVISLSLDDIDGHYMQDAGISKAPLHKGVADSRVELGKSYSRFAGTGPDRAEVMAKLGLREGKLQVLLGDTRAAAVKNVQDSVHRLDKAPKDLARAWALAAKAQYLGLTDEVRYAEQKVAAHNPHVLQEFQVDVKRIQPLTTH